MDKSCPNQAGATSPEETPNFKSAVVQGTVISFRDITESQFTATSTYCDSKIFLSLK